MTIRRILAAFLILAPGLALAQSEGVATFKLIAHSAREDGKAAPAGTYRIAFSKNAYRMDMQMDISSMGGTRSHAGADAPQAFTMTTISKLSDPDKAYMLNDRSKTYSVIDLARARAQAGHSDEKWTVKRTGHDTVAGIPCEKATISSTTGVSIDACIATDFLVSSAWWSALSQRQGGNDVWIKAMGDAGLKGFPIRMHYQTPRGETRVDMELVSLDRHGLPAAMFEVPAGYKQTDMMGTMMTPEQQKMINDALKNMTPEQRKAYEDAMKKAQ
jgi:hypothetical protein